MLRLKVKWRRSSPKDQQEQEARLRQRRSRDQDPLSPQQERLSEQIWHCKAVRTFPVQKAHGPCV